MRKSQTHQQSLQIAVVWHPFSPNNSSLQLLPLRILDRYYQIHFRMTTMARKRLVKEFNDLQRGRPTGVSVTPQPENIMLWNSVISGPEDSIWDGGSFKLTLEFTELYPFSAPTVRFVCRMFHPNIYADGSLCLNILDEQWSTAYRIESILVSIQSLLCDPNPGSPANSEAARLFSDNKREYNRRVREIVEQSQMAD